MKKLSIEEAKEAEDILTKVANEHYYESWGKLMYDYITKEHYIIEYTIRAMQLYHESNLPKDELKLTKDIAWYIYSANSTGSNKEDFEEIWDRIKNKKDLYENDGEEIKDEWIRVGDKLPDNGQCIKCVRINECQEDYIYWRFFSIGEDYFKSRFRLWKPD